MSKKTELILDIILVIILGGVLILALSKLPHE